MSAIIPTPPAAEPQITTKPPSVVPGSFGPTAVTARPDELAALLPRPSSPPPRRRPRFWIGLSLLIAGGAVAARYLPHGKRVTTPTIVSGRAGLKHTKSGQTERWWRDRATLTLDGSLAALSPSAPEAVEEAFGEWMSSDAKLPRLAFDARHDTKPLVLAPDGENRVYLAPIRLPGHEGDLAITLSYANADTGEIQEADVIFNSSRPFGLLDALAAPAPAPGTQGKEPRSGGDPSPDDHGKSTGHSSGSHGPHAPTGNPSPSPGASAGPSAPSAPCSNTYDLRSVATHEAGHFFGLGEDMTTETNTMYYSTPPCNVVKRALKPDDTGQVTSLYAQTPEGASSSSDEPASVQKCSVGSPGRRGRGAPIGLAATLALGAFVTLRRLRR